MALGGSNNHPWVFAALALFFSAPLLVRAAGDSAPQPLTWPMAQTRLATATTLAKSKGDDSLIDKIREAQKTTKQWIDAGNPYKADEIIAKLESAAGLDPGGRTMAGLAISQIPADITPQLEQLEERLDKAMREKDKTTIIRIIATMRRLMGDQAGLPAMANPGWRVEARMIPQDQAMDLFLAAIAAERHKFTQIASATPVPDTRVRYYAEVVIACSEIRDIVQKHRPKTAEQLDKIVKGACTLLLALQQSPGYFPTPDPKNKLLWNNKVDEDGQTQFETGEAGAALLIAGIEYANMEWLSAGLKAADWAAAQPCVKNFSYNAQSIYLLATAHKVTRNKKYFDPAIEKWEIGLAPGLLSSNGRWIDPHNARTVYHLINLRAMAELTLLIKPRTDEETALRESMLKSVKLATKSALDEFERFGITNTGYSLPALWRVHKLDPSIDPRLPVLMQKICHATITASTRDGKTTFGSSPAALAAVARVSP
jgi:hypothetical protein